MWYKVRELFSKGLNKTQISLEIGVHRKRVRKYLAMNENEFYKWIEQPNNQPDTSTVNNLGITNKRTLNNNSLNPLYLSVREMQQQGTRLSVRVVNLNIMASGSNNNIGFGILLRF